MAIATGASVGVAVGAGADPVLPEGTAVGAMAVDAPGAAVGAAGMGVAVADEPQANIAANSSAKGPRIMILGFFNRWYKRDYPPIVVWECRKPLPR